MTVHKMEGVAYSLRIGDKLNGLKIVTPAALTSLIFLWASSVHIMKEGKAIRVTGCGGL
jgi:hypothetical protein